MNDKIKIIQVGTGGWGWSWIQILKNSDEVELSGIVDIDEEALENAKKAYSLDSGMLFTNLKTAINTMQPKAALIVVPPEIHADVTIEALQSRLHCLVEKPIADNIVDAKRMVEEAEKQKLKLMVSQNYRFKNAPQTVKKLVKSNVIGKLGMIYINYQKAPPFAGFRAKMKEPLITDMAIHHFDQTRGILGLEPKKITAFSWKPNWSWFEGNAIAQVLFETAEGVVINYTGSWVSQGWETTWDGDWRIQGDDGEIHWANNEVIINSRDVFKTVFLKDAVEKEGSLVAKMVELDAEEREAVVKRFCNAVVEDKEPETSGRDNLKTLALVLGARKSIDEGKPIEVEDLLK